MKRQNRSERKDQVERERTGGKGKNRSERKNRSEGNKQEQKENNVGALLMNKNIQILSPTYALCVLLFSIMMLWMLYLAFIF